MKKLLCVYKGKSSWLKVGESYWVKGENKTCYWVVRSDYPEGKMYHKKHFNILEVSRSEVIGEAARNFFQSLKNLGKAVLG